MKKMKAFVSVLLSVILTFSIFSINVFALDTDVINIPDTNFKDALIAQGIDTNEDENITKGEMAVFTHLELGYLGISNITGIEHAVNLEYLVLSGNQIEDISSLSGLINLQTLYLSENEIVDISSLASITNLTLLDIKSNNITDISAIASLVNLTYVEISSNNISDITPIAPLVKLTDLYLASNFISDISSISGLQELELLFIYNNQISDISPLTGLSKMIKLNLYNNLVSDIYPIKDIKSISYLILENNYIRDISPIIGFNNLIVLNIDNNYLDISENSPAIELINDLISLYSTSVAYDYQNTSTLAIEVFGDMNAGVLIHGSTSGNATVNIIDADSVTVKKDGLDYVMPADNILYLEGVYFIIAKNGLDQITFTFTIAKLAPIVTGVIDGKTYLTERVITFDIGTATIASTQISGEFGAAVNFLSGSTVSADGKYRLTVTDGAGSQTIVIFCIYTGDYVKGITVQTPFDNTEQKTNYADLKSRFYIESNQTIIVKKDGLEIAPTDLVGTGMTIEVFTGGTMNSTQTIVVVGDINGDALINVADLVLMKKQIFNKTLIGAKLAATNVSCDMGNVVGLADLIKIKKFIMSLDLINQF